jgi:hypothetical protein
LRDELRSLLLDLPLDVGGGINLMETIIALAAAERAATDRAARPLQHLRPERSVAGLAGDFVCGGALA